MTPRAEGATRRVRVCALLLIAGLAAGPLATHVYWMLGGTWGLGGEGNYSATGVRVVGAVVALLLVAAVLVVLARVGLWQQAIVSDRVIRFFAWALAGLPARDGGGLHLEQRGFRVVAVRPGLARARTAGAGRRGLGRSVAHPQDAALTLTRT